MRREAILRVRVGVVARHPRREVLAARALVVVVAKLRSTAWTDLERGELAVTRLP
jgi:hypothetical protein